MITALLGHAALARTAMQADPDSARTRLQEIERIATRSDHM